MLIERAGVLYGRLTIAAPTGSGKRTGWYKHVTGVDRNQKGGYALTGSFVKDGEHDFPIGTVLVRDTPLGSAKHPTSSHSIWIVTPDGGLAGLFDGHDNLCTWDKISPTMIDRVEVALRYSPEVLTGLAEDKNRRIAAREAKEAIELEVRRKEAAERMVKERLDMIEQGRLLLVDLTWPLPEADAELRNHDFPRRTMYLAEFAYKGGDYMRSALARAGQEFHVDYPAGPEEIRKAYTEERFTVARAAILEALAILQPGEVAPPRFSSEELRLIAELRALPEDRRTEVLSEIASTK